MEYRHSGLKKTALLLGLLLVVNAGIGQDLHERPLQKLIDCPSAGGPETHSFDFELRAYPENGILMSLSVGVFSRFTIGMSYGGTEIIGYNEPEWNPQPGVMAAFRILNESLTFPGLAVGFINQGYGTWDKDNERYRYQAKGFYAVLGKNFSVSSIGETGFHFGVNFDPTKEVKTTPDYFTAVDYRMSDQLGIIAEYSLALDDRKFSEAFGRGKGYLNGGIRWSFGERFAIDLHLRDILVNQKDEIRSGNQIGREIRISYQEKF